MITLEQVEAAGGYIVTYSDPAWSYSDKGSNGAADNHYPTLTVEQMKALPIKRLAGKNSVHFMWCTWPFLAEGIELLNAWGFEYKTLAFLWVKSQGEKAFFGMGRWSRGNSEPCLLGVRGKPKRVNASVRQLVFAPEYEAHCGRGTDCHLSNDRTYERAFCSCVCAACSALRDFRKPTNPPEVIAAPRGEHSAKPPEVRDRIVQLMGDVPRIELFARTCAPGWDVWGNQVTSTVSF